jgi:hypothetical protein
MTQCKIKPRSRPILGPCPPRLAAADAVARHSGERHRPLQRTGAVGTRGMPGLPERRREVGLNPERRLPQKPAIPVFPVLPHRPALFFCKLAPYIEGAGSPAMEINDRRNKPFGPGGSTRRLHQSPPKGRVSAGANQDRRGRKGRVFSRYGSAVIGLCNSCKRQLCSGCSGCVTQFERPL